ncbi:uncharacterized protein LOC124159541 isoform X2 [Ischnura elegans]|nr:uncharacterized protein LOC124159541 isoform X2 [Ischnura elegans]
MKEGLMCDKCSEATICKADLTNPTKLTCGDDFTCDELAGGCVVNGICRFNDQFHCPRSDSTETVNYPDPYDCKKYYKCPGRNPTAESCGEEGKKEDEAFDPKEGKCAKISGDMCKDYPVPLCKEEGQSGVIEGTRYSYKCYLGFDGDIEMLYPMFNPVDSATTTTTTQSPVRSTTTTHNPVDPSTTTTKVSSSTQPGYKCPGVGNYKDPSNCKCFHMCYMYAGKIQEKYTCCRAGSHFSEGAQRCVAGDDCSASVGRG